MYGADSILAAHTEIEAVLYSRKLANLLIGLLSLWAIYSILSTAFGVFVVFPFRAVEIEGVPDGRLHSIRLAVMGTFAFYGIMHLLHGSKEVYPMHFLKTYLFFIGLMGTILGISNILDGVDVPWTEWAWVLFFTWVAIVLHLALAPKYRRHFGKK